jgi:hypothetical protein
MSKKVCLAADLILPRERGGEGGSQVRQIETMRRRCQRPNLLRISGSTVWPFSFLYAFCCPFRLGPGVSALLILPDPHPLRSSLSTVYTCSIRFDGGG